MAMNKLKFAAMSALPVTLATTAMAAGDSGTGSMGEMQVGGGMLLLMAGGLVAMGVVIWLIAKFMK